MALKPGTWLGHYEVLDHIGSGGMGEVYRARDNKLQREVALKLLPKAFAQDPERVARFRREAQVLAQLNHPNIAAIYSVEQTRVEQTGDTHFLVMELVPGETLRDRIQRGNPSRDRKGAVASPAEPPLADARGSDGGIPLDEALGIAKQIAAGLEAAHEKPIVHRDLKPANVKVTPEGVVKILDFGLARAFAGDTGSGDPSDSPTLTGMTQPGTILGTAAYMSPEQARGKKVDKRTDIWALGCVLYELLTGKWVFDYQSRDREGAGVPPRANGQPPVAYASGSDSESNTIADILGAVIHKEPDWSSLPASTPPNVRFVLRRCLEKDPKRRFHSATDVAIALEEPWSVPAVEVPPPAALPVPPAWRRVLPWGVAVILSIVTGLTVWNLRPAPPVQPQPVSRLVVPLPPGDQLRVPLALMVAFSPDGTQLAYVAIGRGGTQQLYLRAMDSLEVRAIPGTEGAGSPFFSPDGQWIGFFANGKLKKVSVSGGSALTLCDASFPYGSSWGPNDVIVFSATTAGGLSRVSAAGGTPQNLTTLKEGEAIHRWPQFLPDGKTLLFTSGSGSIVLNEASIVAFRLDTGEQKVLLRGGTFPRYSPTGHLVYYRDGTMMAVPFDLERVEVTGTPSPVLEGVMSSTALSGAGQFAFSSLGSLAYIPGGPAGVERTLVWVDRNGAEQPLAAPPRAYDDPDVSPDGRQIVVQIEQPQSDAWVYDVPRATLTRVTFDGTIDTPIWASDGKRIAFTTVRAGASTVFSKPADGSGMEAELVSGKTTYSAADWSRDGRFFIFEENTPNSGRDIWLLPLEGDPSSREAGSGQGRKPRPLFQTRFVESSPRLSPDGRWLSYASDESGRFEVYVQPFPGPGGKWQVSTDGGATPIWARDGKQLFYRVGNRVMAVDVMADQTFAAGTPKLLFEGPYHWSTTISVDYDVAPDGRFLMIKPTEQAQASTQINVVLNWFEELKRRVPVP